MKRPRRWKWLSLGSTCICLLLSGCGPVLVQSSIQQAELQLERADYLGAAEISPFEYFQAVEYLAKARQEMTDGDFEDARLLAEIALARAVAAVARAQQQTPYYPVAPTP